jgi:hypothetical protein
MGEGWRTPNTYTSRFFGVPDDSPAVYMFLLYDQESFTKAFVGYVGMSKRIARRLDGHPILSELNQTSFWPMRLFKPTPVVDLRRVELSLIQKFDPPWNIQGRKRGVKL